MMMTMEEIHNQKEVNRKESDTTMTGTKFRSRQHPQ